MMPTILELREKRAKAWEAAKAFLDRKKTPDGMLTAEDAAAYDKMEAEIIALKQQIDREERAREYEQELASPPASR